MDGWYIGLDRWDAISFQPRRDVRVHGCGIFEPFPAGDHTFKYGYKYTIHAAGSQEEVHASPVYEEEVQMPVQGGNTEASGIYGEVEDHIIKYIFKHHP